MSTPQPRQRHYNGRLSDPTKPGRRAGTARFATYWKIQRWEARSLTWKDVQRTYDSEAAAWAAAPEGARLMEVSMAGRRPVTR
jgi:hypothetical protein